MKGYDLFWINIERPSFRSSERVYQVWPFRLQARRIIALQIVSSSHWKVVLLQNRIARLTRGGVVEGVVRKKVIATRFDGNGRKRN